jgi:hypothetical protein
MGFICHRFLANDAMFGFSVPHGKIMCHNTFPICSVPWFCKSSYNNVLSVVVVVVVC